jgi:hypothetical protein
MKKQYDHWRHPDHLNDAPEWLEMQLLSKRSPLDHWDHAITDGIALIEAFLPVGGICYDVIYLTRRMSYRGHFFQL